MSSVEEVTQVTPTTTDLDFHVFLLQYKDQPHEELHNVLLYKPSQYESISDCADSD